MSTLGLFICHIYVVYFFMFSFMFIIIDHAISLNWAQLFFAHFLEYAHYFSMIIRTEKTNNFQTANIQLQGIKVLLIKKACIRFRAHLLLS